jgi:hypothetical protein
VLSMEILSGHRRRGNGVLAFRWIPMSSPTTSEPGAASALAIAWTKQYVWSRTATALKSRLTAARITAHLLTIAGAILATAGRVASHESTLATGLAVAAAIAVGITPLVLRDAHAKAIHDWTRARATSETLKAEIYTYMAKVGPYRGPSRDQELTEPSSLCYRKPQTSCSTPLVSNPRARTVPPLAMCQATSNIACDSRSTGIAKARSLFRRDSQL